MIADLAFIGFGEAAHAFVRGTEWRAYDRVPERCADAGPASCRSNSDAVGGVSLILSVVTADQALAAAQETARSIAKSALYCDMNSVAPETKRAAAAAIEAAGGRYVDVAIMAPVVPARLDVPLIVAGPHAAAAVGALDAVGFSNVRAIAGPVGRASAIKMIRSIMVKGIEALTVEMMLAAQAADVRDDVIASLGADWGTKAAYNLERTARHGERRAAEMSEVAKTLVALGVEPIMTRGTITRQRKAAAMHASIPAVAA